MSHQEEEEHTVETHSALQTTNDAVRSSPPYDGLKDLVILNTTLCGDKCIDDCMSYLTPVGKCYNGQTLFPYKNGNEDNPFGKQDIMDLTKLASKKLGIKRIFFDSMDGSCSEKSDEFDYIPLNKCVGPFGPPRPWGMMALVGQEAKSFT